MIRERKTLERRERKRLSNLIYSSEQKKRFKAIFTVAI